MSTNAKFEQSGNFPFAQNAKNHFSRFEQTGNFPPAQNAIVCARFLRFEQSGNFPPAQNAKSEHKCKI
jgi:hypothetical protein